MKPRMKHSFLWTMTLLVIACVLIMQPFQGAPAANAESAAATYSHGALRVFIPYHVPHSGAGQLTVEVLDPEDKVLGRSEQRVDVNTGKGSWQDELKLTKAVGIDDLAWHRLRYRFAYSDQDDAALQGTESISQILR